MTRTAAGESLTGAGSTETTPSALWHPFSDMTAVPGNEFIVDRASGVWVYDKHGREFLDSTASLWCVNAGHGREEIREAVDRQFRKLDSFSIFGDYSNEPAMALADRIAELAPVDDAKVLFGSGGGDGVDTAARLARQYFHAIGQTDKTHIISRHNSYHGTHGWGITLAGIPANRAGNGQLAPAATQIRHDSADALEQEILRIGAEHVAAFFCEPIIGAGGVHLPQGDYLRQVADICRRYGVLLIIDSVICAFGRLGTWFGVERWDIRPDMIVFAKGVSNGSLPLGGVVISGEISSPFWNRAGNPFRHGATYSGHPVCSAAALATLDILGSDGLLEQGRMLEKPLADRLGKLIDHGAVEEVRAGTGLIGAVELKSDILHANPRAVLDAFGAARAAGVLLRPLGTSLAVSPPLTISEAELDIMVDGIRAGLDTIVT